MRYPLSLLLIGGLTNPRFQRPCVEAAFSDRFPTPFHEAMVKVKVVEAIELRSKDLAGHIEMTEIGTGKIATAIAAAGVIHRPWIMGEFRAFDAQFALERKQHPVTRVARRDDAIEHIKSCAHGLEDILGTAHTHEVTRLTLRQEPRGKRPHGVKQFRALSHA